MTRDEANTIWELLPHPSRDHVVRLFARKGTEVKGDFARNAREIFHFANAYNGEYNCYICPNPTTRKDGIRHSAADVTHWSYFFLDIDPIKEEYDAMEAMLEAIAAFNGIAGHNLFDHQPTIIDSGRGMQVWFHGVDEDLIEKPDLRGMSRRAMSYWLGRIQQRMINGHGCKIDPSVSDLPRPMRLPGTINLKTGEPARLLNIQEGHYPWLQFLLLGGCPKEILVRTDVPQAREGAKWQEVFRYLTPTAQSYLTKGWEEPGRHKTVWHTAKSLQEHGVSRGQAAKAIYRANKFRGPDQELSPGELEHALDTAYGADREEIATLTLTSSPRSIESSPSDSGVSSSSI